MKSKTLTLINRYNRLIKEAGEDPSMDAQAAPDPSQDAAATSQPEVVPLTSQGENILISNLVDAALFKPTPDQEKELLDLQNAIAMKKVTNLRQDVEPTVLAMISDVSSAKDIKTQLNTIG